MNIENLKLLRDAVAKSMAFDMEEWPLLDESDVAFDKGHYCGTPACIGGHAEALIIDSGIYLESRFHTVSKWVDLTYIQYKALFFPTKNIHGFHLDEITKEHAVRCLDHLIKTGEVDWRVTK